MTVGRKIKKNNPLSCKLYSWYKYPKSIVIIVMKKSSTGWYGFGIDYRSGYEQVPLTKRAWKFELKIAMTASQMMRVYERLSPQIHFFKFQAPFINGIHLHSEYWLLLILNTHYSLHYKEWKNMKICLISFDCFVDQTSIQFSVRSPFMPLECLYFTCLILI